MATHFSHLRLTLRDIGVVIVLTVIAATGLAAEEQKETPPKTVKAPLAFTQTEVFRIEWEQRSEQRIEITSGDGKEHKLRVQLGDFGFRDVNGGAIASAEVIKIEPGEGVVTPQSSLFLTVATSRNVKIRPGVYLGSIIAIGDDETSKGTIVRLAAQVAVSDVQPLTPKLTIYSYRSIPFTHRWKCDNCRLPLKNATAVEGSLLFKDVPLGALTNDQGGVATVWWSGQMVREPGGPLELAVDIRGLDNSGKYEGVIRANPQDATDSGKIALVVNASDNIIWPIIVIGLGILLALWMKRYVGVNRTIWKLKEQEAALGGKFKESQRRFAETSRTRAYHAYSIAASLEEKRADIVRKIKALQKSSNLNIETNDADYVLVREALKQLEDQINAWATFAEELKGLESALNKIHGLGVAPPAFEGTEPAFLSGYRALLHGGVITLNQFESKRKKLGTSSAGVALLADLNSRILRDRKLLDGIVASGVSLNEPQQKQLKGARALLDTVRDKLWTTTTIDELATLVGPDSDLESAHETLIQLSSEFKGTTAGSSMEILADLASPDSSSGFDVSRALSELAFSAPADDAGRERFYAGAVQRWDLMLTLIAFLIAVLTGLHTYYLGQPFGTLKDYVGLFLWAVGTKVVVDTASTALQWVFSGKLAGRLSASY